MALTKGEVMQGAGLVKALSTIIERAGDDEMIRAKKVLHERMKRWAEDNGHGDVVVLGGDT